MSIFKTECDSRCVTETNAVVRSAMEMDDPAMRILPGFQKTSYADVQHVNPGAVRRNKAKG